MASLTQRDLMRALKVILPPLDPEAVTFGSVVGDLARHFGVEKAELKANHREELKQIIPDMLHLCTGGVDKENVPESEEEDEDDGAPVARKTKRARGRRIQESDDEEDDDEMDESEDDASGDDSEEEPQPKRRKKASPVKKTEAAPAQRKTPAPRKVVKDSEGMAALKELARVSGLLSPAVYAQLKKLESEEEQEDALRDRLQDAGVRFTAPYPKKNEITAAKRKREKEKELDGIDTSLIITGGRSRRSSAQQVLYTASYNDDDDEDEQDEGADQNEDEEELHDKNEEESEAHEEEGSEASDDSEAEF